MGTTPYIEHALNIIYAAYEEQKKKEMPEIYTAKEKKEGMNVDADELALLSDKLDAAIAAAKRVGYWAAKRNFVLQNYPQRDRILQNLDCALTAVAIALGREMIDEINIIHKTLTLEVENMIDHKF